MSVGRRIERLQFQCTTLQQGLQTTQQDDLDWLLELGDSTITYRSRYMARPEWMPVLDLLVRDDSNPRSVAFQLKGLNDSLVRLAGDLGPCGADELAQGIDALRSLDPARDLDPASERLSDLLIELQAASLRLSEQLGLRFFSHSLVQQTFAR